MDNKTIISQLLQRKPRCLADVDILEAGINEKLCGGHGEPYNVVFWLKCKSCQSETFFIHGYDWYNEHYKMNIFASPIEVECGVCSKKVEIFNATVHGYDPELNDFPCGVSGEGSPAQFGCDDCKKVLFKVKLTFSYTEDLWTKEFDDCRGREQDLFTWITIEAKCLQCERVLAVTDYECA